jgi:hypothetical protein
MRDRVSNDRERRAVEIPTLEIGESVYAIVTHGATTRVPNPSDSGLAVLFVGDVELLDEAAEQPRKRQVVGPVEVLRQVPATPAQDFANTGRNKAGNIRFDYLPGKVFEKVID